jgi:Uma2 family endonuclease
VNAVPYSLTIEAFERLYGDEKPYYEYWDGQAIQKPMPTILHSLLQFILVQLFWERGLAAGAEVRIKLSNEKQPLPDVIADERLQHPYPTKPFAIAVEILSPEDKMQRTLRKCRFYAEQGIRYIYVLDPEDRTSQRWNVLTGSLELIGELELPSRPAIPMTTIWSALDERPKTVDVAGEPSTI